MYMSYNVRVYNVIYTHEIWKVEVPTRSAEVKKESINGLGSGLEGFKTLQACECRAP